MKMTDLTVAYLTDPNSSFHALRYATRQGYQRNIAQLVETFGEREFGTIAARDLMQVYAGWISGGKVTLGHGLMTQLRIVIGFGSTVLEDSECQRLRGILSGLRFKNPAPRETWITPEQVTAVRDEAIRQKFYAIALAQALQFDCALRQKDCLGEWIPIGEPEPSSIVSPDGKMKWVRGVTREEVNSELVLTHKTSKRNKVLSFPLSSCPMVMEEWFSAPPSGPLIIDPFTDLPYEAWSYRRTWRWLATRAGVPKNVWNMDSRAGRITQLLANGVLLEDARKLAGHAQQSTTSRYSRGASDAITRALNTMNENSQD